MKRFTKPLLVFGVFLLFIGFSAACLLAETTPSLEVLAAAQKGLVDFPGLNDVSLQQGFQVFTVSPTALMTCSELGSVIIPTGQWRFLVFSGGQPMGLLTVAQIEGHWQAVSMGGAGLATEMSRVLKTWSPENGYNFRFVRIYQAMTDLVEITRVSDSLKPGYVPMTSARASLGIQGEFAPEVILNDSQIITPLRDVVAKNIKMFEAQQQK